MKAVGIILGVITVLLGIYAFSVPFETFQIISWVIALVVIVNGVESIADGATAFPKKNVGKIVLGSLVVIAGLMIMFGSFMRLLTDMVLAFIIGGALIVYGIFQITGGLKKKEFSTSACVVSVICGVLSVIAGFLAFGHPLLTMISVGYIIAFNLIMQGVNMIVIAVNRDRA